MVSWAQKMHSYFLIAGRGQILAARGEGHTIHMRLVVHPNTFPACHGLPDPCSLTCYQGGHAAPGGCLCVYG